MDSYLTPQELFEFALNRTIHATDRPNMYAASPECFETYLFLLDEIMGVIVKADPLKNGFNAFLSEREYGSATICSRSKIDGESLTEAELFARIVKVWQEYRKSQYAISWPPDEPEVN